MKKLNDVSEATTCLLKSEASTGWSLPALPLSSLPGSFSRGLNPIMLSCTCRSGLGLTLTVKQRADTWCHGFPFGVRCRIRQVCFFAYKGLFGHTVIFLVPFYFNYWWSFTFFSFHTWWEFSVDFPWMENPLMSSGPGRAELPLLASQNPLP